MIFRKRINSRAVKKYTKLRLGHTNGQTHTKTR